MQINTIFVTKEMLDDEGYATFINHPFNGISCDTEVVKAVEGDIVILTNPYLPTSCAFVYKPEELSNKIKKQIKDLIHTIQDKGDSIVTSIVTLEKDTEVINHLISCVQQATMWVDSMQSLIGESSCGFFLEDE